MQLKSIVQSTAIFYTTGFIEGARNTFVPDIVNALVNRFSFVSYPQTPEEISSADGLKFQHGRGNGFVIGALTIFADGIYCQGSVKTETLQKLVRETLDFLIPLGFKAEGQESSWFFNSQLEVGMSGDIGIFLDKLQPIVDTVTYALRGQGVDVSRYDVWGFSLGGEGPGTLKPGRFLLERRIGYPMGESIYYSEAPFGSEQHWNILEGIEASFILS